MFFRNFMLKVEYASGMMMICEEIMLKVGYASGMMMICEEIMLKVGYASGMMICEEIICAMPSKQSPNCHLIRLKRIIDKNSLVLRRRFPLHNLFAVRR